MIYNSQIMPETFSQIYIQIVFAVKGRDSLIAPVWEDELYKYVTGIVQNKGQKMLSINGTEDQIHFFVRMKPNCCLSDLARKIKKSSNVFIKEKRLAQFPFQWQGGFGAFLYSHSALDRVIQYIRNQKKHHKKSRSKMNMWNFYASSMLNFGMKIFFE
jgi:REP element-mobilizing transposase RayT